MRSRTILIMSVGLLLGANAWASYAIYVGKNLTEDGSVMIGGSGEKKTLRLVAKYGDACNLFVNSPEEATHKLQVLRDHCATAGTDYDSIRKTMLYTGGLLPGSDYEGFVAEMAGFAAAGIEGVMVMPLGPDPVRFTEAVAMQVVPRLAEL